MSKKAEQVENQQTTDILIVGGGLVGSSLALALSTFLEKNSLDSSPANKKALTITLVEATDITANEQPSFDDRSTVLSQSSANLFADIGVWSAIKPQSAAIQHIHTSDKGHIGLSRLHAEDYQLEAMGYVVDNRTLGRELYKALEKHSNVTRLMPAKVEKLTSHDSHYACQVSTSEKAIVTYQAKLVVLCDGGRSSLAQQLGLHEQVTHYQQAALIANIELTRPHGGWAYERFTSQGPIAMLPLKHNQNRPRSALVWTTPLADLERRLALTDSNFLAELQQEFGQRLGRFNRVGERASYPLKVQKTDELVRSRLAVLGNAAHTLHPVAGQGFNLALRGAFLLAQTVLIANEQGQDIGAYSILKRYAEAQCQDRDRIQQASHGLISLFGNQNKLVSAGRNLGLLALDNCPLLKTSFARSAMGLDIVKPIFRTR